MESWNFGAGKGLQTNLVFVAVREIMAEGSSVNWEELSRSQILVSENFFLFPQKVLFPFILGAYEENFYNPHWLQERRKGSLSYGKPHNPHFQTQQWVMMRP